MKRLCLLYTFLTIISLYAADEFNEAFSAGNQAFKNGDYILAAQKFKEASSYSPSAHQPHFNLGLVYEQINDTDHAIQAYREAIAAKPDYAKAHERLGQLLQRGGQIDDAITHYCVAINADSSKTDLALTVARLFCEKERFSDSLKYYEIAFKAKPDDIVLRFEYANALNTCNYTKEALAHYLHLLKIRPDDSSILYNTAYTYKKLGSLKDALPYYNAALEKKPDHAEAHFSLGLAYLADGDFEKGWPKYEWRWQRGTQLSPRELKQPQWDGTPLNGKKILIHAEQGLGDTFQFIRYAKVVKEQFGGEVIVAVQHPLHVFAIRCCPYIDKVIPLSHIYTQECDVQIPLMTIPLVLKTTEKTIPVNIPYLVPEPVLVTYWGQKLAADKNFKVGICWQGNSKYSSPFLRAVVAAKSLPLEKFKPLLQTPGVSFYSLQKQTGEEQIKEWNGLNLKTFDADFDDKHGRFMDTAAVIKHLDLVITIDTSISHLAAALGKPVWIMIPEPPDWRWMLERDDTPWYPNNMRLFRQPTQGDWDNVIATMTQELQRVLKTKAPLIEFRKKGESLKKQTTSDSSNKISPINTPTSNTKAASIPNNTPSTALKPVEKVDAPKTPVKSSTRTQLEYELGDINNRLLMISQAIKNGDASPDNELFIKNMRNFYMLTELRSQLRDKVSALEGN
jgi:tetratricopeptide (TPR) repeat protein